MRSAYFSGEREKEDIASQVKCIGFFWDERGYKETLGLCRDFRDALEIKMDDLDSVSIVGGRAVQYYYEHDDELYKRRLRDVLASAAQLRSVDFEAKIAVLKREYDDSRYYLPEECRQRHCYLSVVPIDDEMRENAKSMCIEDFRDYLVERLGDVDEDGYGYTMPDFDLFNRWDTKRIDMDDVASDIKRIYDKEWDGEW